MLIKAEILFDIHTQVDHGFWPTQRQTIHFKLIVRNVPPDSHPYTIDWVKTDKKVLWAGTHLVQPDTPDC